MQTLNRYEQFQTSTGGISSKAKSRFLPKKKKKITKLYTPWLWQHQTEIPQQTKVLHTEHFHTRAQISRPLCCFGYSSLKIMELKQYNP